MGIDLRKHFTKKKWFASCFYDDDRAGLVTEDNVIVLGIGAGMNYAQAKKLADEHNATLTREEQRS